MPADGVLGGFRPAVGEWFARSFAAPTPAQERGWPPILRGESTLLLAPTGSGKTLAAFLSCLDRLVFSPEPARRERLRVLYVSPLKALAVDVERNLRAPLAGIAQAAAARGDAFRVPTIAVRSGDTPAAERARFARDPADVLITTPESLYLLLTSNARETLRGVETVIVDEIHALVPTKRGAHLALSLERLEALAARRLQRIGLSATQRPLDEVARFLGGVEGGAPRPVTVVDAGSRKALELTVEVPVEDMSRLGQPLEIASGPASQGPVRASIWTAIHPRLLELVRAHRTTLVFVNSRRIAERLAAALNELAGEVIVHAHHGSVARPQRLAIEDALKAGRVRALVATSSLELGIDMGAVDLVVQIEAPPSVASGMQRIGRAGHRIDEPSRGVIFPKYRSDLLACAGLTAAMHEGQVEATRYPRNPLDVLAQQIVAMVSLEDWDVEALHAALRRAAPFADLGRGVYHGVLDMLSGLYPSDELSDLRPRITWDRVAGRLQAREGARRIAIVNGGTIPDRGLYGVFLAGGDKGRARVGELDEEMVFESRVGETFVLGASTWRIEEITHDRVLVSPAPGEPGKLPFWHGDAAGRPLELGRAIGRLVRELRELPPAAARERLLAAHDLEPRAADNLLQFLDDQARAAGAVPDDRTLVVERCQDELGDWRVCVLSPFGGQVLAPWSMAAAARARERLGVDAEALWTNDGFALRLPGADEPPDVSFLFPEPEEVEDVVVAELGGSALFAAKFREAAARSLLLPRRRPGGRAPLWQQRKRAADLLAVAARYPSFPVLLEAHRECLRDVFDLPALVELLRDVRARRVRVVTADTRAPSPFAASLLFGFVASFIYDGDAPLAERRAQALTIDQAQLRELLGEAELREILDADALVQLEARLQHLEPQLRARSADAVADLLLRLGDLSRAEVAARAAGPELAAAAVDRLLAERRAVALRLGGEERLVAVEDAARYRDGLGAPLPPGLPDALLGPVPDALDGLVARFARRHAPFGAGEVAARFGLGRGVAEAALGRLTARGRLLEGAFRPHGAGREWCDPEVLRALRRRSLALLREQIEPVEPRVFARMLLSWHGVTRRARGLDAVLDAVERLQGAPLVASLLETELLPARVEGYLRGDLDALAAAGEVSWVGLEPLGERDGRIALFLADALPRLLPPGPAPAAQALRAGRVEDGAARRADAAPLSDREARLVEALAARGASFFADLHAAVGGGFEAHTVDALWSLVWRGLVTNDGFQALRAHCAGPPARQERGRRRPRAAAYRSRLSAPPSAGGRWTLVAARRDAAGPRPTATAWSAAVAEQLLARYGLVTREVAQVEGLPGGFGAVYDVFRHLEEGGRIRRGYFVGDVGAMQFAQPGVLDLLRSLRDPPEEPEVTVLAATDPANPWGALLRWPAGGGEGRRPARAVGAQVVMVDGELAAWLARGARQVLTWLPELEPDRSRVAAAAARAITALLRAAQARGEAALVAEIDGAPAAAHPLAAALQQAGFLPSAMGLQLPRRGAPPPPPPAIH
jgi:ATP-dependent Lhr-like helicase